MILPSLHSYTKDIDIGAKRNLMLINGLSPFSLSQLIQNLGNH